LKRSLVNESYPNMVDQVSENQEQLELNRLAEDRVIEDLYSTIVLSVHDLISEAKKGSCAYQSINAYLRRFIETYSKGTDRVSVELLGKLNALADECRKNSAALNRRTQPNNIDSSTTDATTN